MAETLYRRWYEDADTPEETKARLEESATKHSSAPEFRSAYMCGAWESCYGDVYRKLQAALAELKKRKK